MPTDLTDEQVISAIENRVRPVLEPIALDDAKIPIRFRNHHGPCGARIWVGHHDFNGLRWLARYYAEADDRTPIAACPVCAGPLDRRTVLTELEMDRLIDAVFQRGAPLDARLIVALTALFARTGEELRTAIQQWCAMQPVTFDPQSQTVRVDTLSSVQ